MWLGGLPSAPRPLSEWLAEVETKRRVK